MRLWRNWYTRSVESLWIYPVEVQVFSAAPNIMMEDKTNNNFSAENSVEVITHYLDNYQNSKILDYLNNLHNADIADLIQNLDPVLRLSLINIISNKFDPEILTYLNDSLRDEIVEILDIKQLASNAKELEIDDAVDLVEDLEEKDQNIF